MTDDPLGDSLEAAWAGLHAANDALGWFVGPPTYEPHRTVPWSMYAMDPHDAPKVGKRAREWTAQHPTQIGVVREMARCLREIGAGRVPK